SPIEFIPYDQAYEPGFEDMMRRVPSVDKLHAITGFRPQTPLNEIIDRVTAYFQSKSEPARQIPTYTVYPCSTQFPCSGAACCAFLGAQQGKRLRRIDSRFQNRSRI